MTNEFEGGDVRLASEPVTLMTGQAVAAVVDIFGSWVGFIAHAQRSARSSEGARGHPRSERIIRRPYVALCPQAAPTLDQSQPQGLGHGVERVGRHATLAGLSTDRLDELVSRAVAELPAPIVRRNPTIANPFVRTNVFELATG
jgi:hypothetical protein